jgi:hypothetical protein
MSKKFFSLFALSTEHVKIHGILYTVHSANQFLYYGPLSENMNSSSDLKKKILICELEI